MWYRVIKSEHIRVELLYDHEGTSDRDITKRLPTPTVDDSGKVSIGKGKKNDLAFQMNATSRKVLRKVLMGFTIMEPNRRSRIRKMVPRNEEGSGTEQTCA